MNEKDLEEVLNRIVKTLEGLNVRLSAVEDALQDEPIVEDYEEEAYHREGSSGWGPLVAALIIAGCFSAAILIVWLLHK